MEASSPAREVNGLEKVEWLADLYKWQCFTTSETANPAISSDLGVDGFTASLTSHHMLLQVTAPDPHCGLVFVRGRFANNAGSILARAQGSIYRKSRDLFGTRLARATHDSDIEYSATKAQGWINLRWPYVHYELKRKNMPGDRDTGSLEQITFVRHGVVFQAIRVKWGSESSVGGCDHDDDPDVRDTVTINLQTGGRVRFGCPCSATRPPKSDNFDIRVDNEASKVLTCISSKYERRLETQFFVNGISEGFNHMSATFENAEAADTTTIHALEVSKGQPTYIVYALAIRGVNDPQLSAQSVPFDDIEDYLGIGWASTNMIDRLWTAACSPNYEGAEAVEGCAIGRGVEQILGVAAIPLCPKGVKLGWGEEGPQLSQKKDWAPESFEIALVQTIMTAQFIDIQSTFFQIRLLVKAHNFIASRHLEIDLLEDAQPLENIRANYLRRIRRALEAALGWLVNTDFRRSRILPGVSSLGSNHHQGPSPRRQDECDRAKADASFDQDYNRSCYATIAVWYVMKHCASAVSNEFKTRILSPKLASAYQSVQSRAARDKEPTPKNDILQWYHMSTLLLICDQTIETEDSGTMRLFEKAKIDRQELLHTQQRFQRYASRLKPGKMDYYSSKHEELDRVVLLGEELGLESLDREAAASAHIVSRARQTKARLEARRRTPRFNQGPTAWNARHEPLNSPWELVCTNHELYLRIASESNIESVRQRVFEYMTSDYSFMASWDISDGDMIAKWWDFEPGAIICATIIDLKTEGRLPSAALEAPTEQNIKHSIGELPSQADLALHQPDHSEWLDPHNRHNQESPRGHQAKQFLGTNESGRPFEWIDYKPRSEFHPVWWTHSLDDTPEFYEVKQTRNVYERHNFIKYLETRRSRNVVEDAIYAEVNIREKIESIDLQALSCFDLCLTDQSDLRLQDVKAPSESTESTVKLHYRLLMLRLRDSLVDLDVKHRILFARKCTPSLVGAMVYLWHPEALNAIDSYFGTTSRFMESREGMSWTTSINISHWVLSKCTTYDIERSSFYEGRKNGEFPPNSIAKIGATKKQLKHAVYPRSEYAIEEQSSLLVVTGDSFGHLWICSLWSSLTNSDTVRSVVGGAVRRVQQKFIHQQNTGRCLVFLVLLGHLCEKLADEYENILERLDAVVGLGEEVLLQGIDWASNEAIEKLKKMLWGLEALRAFDERLSASIHQIQRAREAMERTGSKDSNSRNTDLLHEYQQVIDAFTKRFDMLSDVDLRTKLKIKQVTGLRDGISTVTNVEDSQATLKNADITVRQGNNIRTLTYITIAYLPIGFVTGLFSIDYVQFMQHAGDVTFAVLMTVAILVTYTVALFLQDIIDKWSNLTVRKHKTRGDSNPRLTSDLTEPRKVLSMMV